MDPSILSAPNEKCMKSKKKTEESRERVRKTEGKRERESEGVGI